MPVQDSRRAPEEAASQRHPDPVGWMGEGARRPELQAVPGLEEADREMEQVGGRGREGRQKPGGQAGQEAPAVVTLLRYV